MSSPEERVKLAHQESQDLTRYLNSIPPKAWDQPSACHRWQVKDVVAHLAGGADYYTRMVSRGLQGDSSPPDGYPAPGSVNGASTAEGIAERAIAAQVGLGGQVLATFVAQDSQLNQLFAGIRGQGWSRPCYHPANILTAQDYVGLRVLEVAIHSWDIRSKLEPSYHLSAGSVAAITELLPVLIPWVMQPDTQQPGPVRCRFQLSGSKPSASDIVVKGGKVFMEAATGGGADVTFSCNPETFVLLLYGRLKLGTAMAGGLVTAKGKTWLASQFGQWLTGA